MAKAEDLPLPLGVALFSEDPGESGSTTLDWTGLVPTGFFPGSEARVKEETLLGNLDRIAPGFSFSHGGLCGKILRGVPGADTGLAIVALKKFFHNPDGPLYKVPRTVTFGEPAGAPAGVSRRRLGDEDTDTRAVVGECEGPPIWGTGFTSDGDNGGPDGLARWGLALSGNSALGSYSGDCGVG